jgi:hypothetical protein
MILPAMVGLIPDSYGLSTGANYGHKQFNGKYSSNWAKGRRLTERRRFRFYNANNGFDCHHRGRIVDLGGSCQRSTHDRWPKAENS